VKAQGQTGVSFCKYKWTGSRTVGEREQEENPIMRATEVRQLLKIGRNTLYEWCEQGIIPHKRIGRVILFSRKRIQEWLENNENERREN